MDLSEYRMIFLASIIALMLIVALPAISFNLTVSDESESFSQIWILGPNHEAENYPFNIRVNETYSLTAGVGNHMGSVSYYMIYLKFRNQTLPLPNAVSSDPSPMKPVLGLRGFVSSGGSWETSIDFRVLETSRQGDYLLVTRLSINDEPHAINVFAKWDPEFNGFYYQLFLELWLYSITSNSFQYDNRFVGIWLNVTV